jgi:hypothetical protein
MNNEIPSLEIDSYETPEWLAEMLDTCRRSGAFNLPDGEAEQVSPELLSRYTEAAGIAYSVALLRKERQRVGFVPLSFSDYVNGLMKVNKVALPPVLKWFGIGDLSRPEPAAGRAFARLAQALGMDVREALAHIRIGFAALIDSAPIPLLVARHRSAGPRASQMEECEAVLGEIESDYDLQSLKQLRRTEFEIRAAYKELEKAGS